MWYELRAAGTVLHLDIPFPLARTRESDEFLRGPAASSGTFAPADLTVRFSPADTLPELPASGHWEIDNYYADRQVFLCALRGQPPHTVVVWIGENLISCEYLRGQEDRLRYSRNIWDTLGLETLLLHRGGLLLHASFIRLRDGRGVVFSAPSGTGKSTQADLWAVWEGAEILNGDRAALLPGHGGWTSWGLPYAGSSEIYRNESAPLAAVVLLRQAAENRASRLPGARAFAGLLAALLASVPAYLLECRPDRGAVETLKQVLNEKGEVG